MRIMGLLFYSLTHNSACQGEFGNAQDFSRDMKLNKNSSVASLGLKMKSFHLINIKCGNLLSIVNL